MQHADCACMLYMAIHPPTDCYMHLTAFFPGQTWVSRHQKGKLFWILLEQETMGWQWHQLDHMQIICTSLHTDNHARISPLSFLQTGCPSCRPTDSVKALKADRDTQWSQRDVHHKNASVCWQWTCLTTSAWDLTWAVIWLCAVSRSANAWLNCSATQRTWTYVTTAERIVSNINRHTTWYVHLWRTRDTVQYNMPSTFCTNKQSTSSVASSNSPVITIHL